MIPLGRDHLHAWAELVEGVTAAADVATSECSHPHVTLIAYSSLSTATVRDAVEDIAAATAPFTIRAHGYGFFTGTEPSELSLHVPVVRTAALDHLHHDLCVAIHRAGAQVAGWSEPELWSPHITLLDHVLDPVRLAHGTAWLAQRHHPSWRILVDRVALTGGWPEQDRPAQVIRFGAKPTGGPAGAE